MGCIHSDFDGECILWEKDSSYNPWGCDEEDGTCMVEEDPNPLDTCEDYESNDPDEDYDEDY